MNQNWQISEFAIGVDKLTVKEQFMQILQELPHDVSTEDVIERLYLIYKIEQGIEQANAGKKISQVEASERIRIKL
ncbi:MAG: hypothetical protein ONB37_10675 [candidate division KSB1 bacterium]|nr:hypothetical protein [candidate division KSB1 bacterium]